MLADWIVALAPAFPALGALAIAAWLALGFEPSERVVVRIATTSLFLSFGAVLFGAARWLGHGFDPVDVSLGHFYKAGDVGYELRLLIDGISAPFAVVSGLLLLATCRFSANYLHRERGFVRFFALVLVFATGLQLAVLGGSFEILFAGWELVGLTSVLLVAFFHERRGPVRAAIRVFATYRLCDVGLLVGIVLLHEARHSSAYVEALHGGNGGGLVSIAVLGLVLAAMGKSAQFPVGGWLPRAMEGPTASSAVFYGSLSVHAGVYLLARAAPLYEGSLWLRVLIIAIGAVTAAVASLSAQVSADAKTSMAHSTTAQMGIMFVECGLGLPSIAILHLVTHAVLRYYQFLRTPSVLQDALKRRAALGTTLADEAAARWAVIPVAQRRFLYRLAIEHFESETTLQRWITEPALRAAATLDRLEHVVMHGSDGVPPGPPRATPPNTGPSSDLVALDAGKT